MKLISKGWGYELEIVNNEIYCGKILHFVKGKKCSLHFHRSKHETFYCASGEIYLTWADIDCTKGFGNWFIQDPDKATQSLTTMIQNTMLLKPGDTFTVPPFRIHQMEAQLTSELFEFSTHHEDSDSYRIIKGD